MPSASHSTPAEECPERLGPYRVVRHVARGGMAAVFEVEEPETGRRLALKLLQARGRSGRRFEREYLALTRLDHPNIVRVFRFGRDQDERPYLTLELLDGDAAQVHVKRRGRPGAPERTSEACRVAREVAQALDYLHAQGIVHRDLKSSNVVVRKDGRVKLLDFGTVRVEEDDEPITRHGEFVGTFAYAAPEQIQGRSVDARADLYALGVLLYRLVTGRRPFEADTPEALSKLHLEVPPRHPSELVPGLDPDLCELILELLSKRADERPVSAAEVAERLAPHIGLGLSPRARPRPRLIGREDVLSHLEELLRDGGVGGRLILIDGPLGSGTGHLLRLQCRTLRSRGWSAHHQDHLAGAALGGVAGLVRDLSRGASAEGRAAARPLLALLSRPAPALDDAAREHLLAGVVRLAGVHCSHGRPLLLALRTIERTPPLGLAALARLLDAAATEGWPLVVAGTTRSLPVARRVLRDIAPVHSVSLRDLALPEVRQLVADVLGHRMPPVDLCRRVHQVSGGRPGFVVELVHTLLQEGLLEAIEDDRGRVHWTDLSAGRTPVPPRVARSLQRRIDASDRLDRRVLDALALAGLPLTSSELAQVLEAPTAQIQQSLQALSDRGLLHREPDGRSRMAVGLFAVRLRELVRPHRRAVLTERLAAVVSQHPPSPTLSRLLLHAQRPVPAARALLHWAASCSDEELAETTGLVRRLTRIVQQHEDTELGLSIGLLQLRAALLHDPEDRRLDRQIQLLSTRLGQLPQGPDSPSAAQLALLQGRLALRRGQAAQGETHLRAALAHARRLQLPAVEQDALAHLADAAEARAAPAEAAGWWQLLLETAAAHSDAEVVARARVGCGRVALELGDLRAAAEVLEALPTGASPPRLRARLCLLQGRYSEALLVMQRPLAEQDAGIPRSTRATVLDHLALLDVAAALFLELNWLGEVRECLQRMEALRPAQTLPEQRVRIALLRGRLLLASGAAALAHESLDEAADGASALDLPQLRCWAQVWMAVARAHQRRWGEAERHRAAALAHPPSRLGTLMRHELELVIAETWAAREAPRSSAAAVASWASAAGSPPILLRYRLAELRHAQATGDAPRAAQCREAASELLRILHEANDATMGEALRLHPWSRTLAQAAPGSRQA